MPATLQDKLRAKQFVITAEVTPPVSADRAEFLAKALPLKGLADAVNVISAPLRQLQCLCNRASNRSCSSLAATVTA
jgi:hypothetical protein